MTDTLRGALLMTLAMAMFAVEDALIKGLAVTLSAAQIIWMLGFGGTLALAADFLARREPLWLPDYRSRLVMLRTLFEAVGSLFFVSALATVPLALASAVIQATPLVVALGAVVFFGATVGWRRWLAIGVGFGGVLIILRPGAEGFDLNALLAVGGMLGLAARDLCTRAIPGSLSGARLSMLAFAALTLAGLLLQIAQGEPFVAPALPQYALLVLCVAIGLVAYLAIVAATRTGDLAVVSSFRYSRMLFALVIAVTFFAERPDLWTIVGAVIVIGSGVFTLLREARMANASSPSGTTGIDD